MKNYTALILVVLISVHAMPINNSMLTSQTVHEVSPKATGVDLSVTDVDYSYPDLNDRNKYQMFSSNYPIANFNKPESLYVCLLYTSPSPRDKRQSRMPSSA